MAAKVLSMPSPPQTYFSPSSPHQRSLPTRRTSHTPPRFANHNTQHHPNKRVNHSSQSPSPARTTVVSQESSKENLVALNEEEQKKREMVLAIEGLSCLASQHHLSDYNRIRYGENGSPAQYIPLSIQVPAHVSSIMSKQAQFEQFCATCPRPSSVPPLPLVGEELVEKKLSDEEGMEGVLVGDGGVETPVEESMAGVGGVPAAGQPGIQSELVKPGPSGPQVTSVSESVTEKRLEMSGVLSPQAKPSDVVATLQHQILQAMEDRILTPPEPALLASPRSSSIPLNSSSLSEIPTAPSSSSSTSFASKFFPLFSGNHFNSTSLPRPSVLAAVHHESPPPIPHTSANPLYATSSLADPKTLAPKMKTSDTHPINISVVIPPSLLCLLAPLRRLASVSVPENQPYTLPTIFDLHPNNLASSDAGPLLPGPDTQPTVGNFFLSSCPGKKVRLQGPVKGRGAICRDLGSDLGRIRSLGVGCIVCCLDDDELRFLGAPYEEYDLKARSAGMDVIRIPMPEGLTPTSIRDFDAHLSNIISSYTLKGINVLAHCRGGVGRAGLVASCWSIKMGLIVPSPNSEFQECPNKLVDDQATMEVVEKVIGVVRRRRSIKAIETFEQVRWLVDYVSWMRQESVPLGSLTYDRPCGFVPYSP